MTDQTTDDRHVRPFADVLRDLRKGLTHDELSEQLADVVAAVEEHRKKGKVVLTIEVEPYKDTTEALAVRDSIKVTIPEPDRDATLMFADRGRITRHNPRQGELPGLSVVDGPPAADSTDEEVAR